MSWADRSRPLAVPELTGVGPWEAAAPAHQTGSDLAVHRPHNRSHGRPPRLLCGRRGHV